MSYFLQKVEAASTYKNPKKKSEFLFFLLGRSLSLFFYISVNFHVFFKAPASRQFKRFPHTYLFANADKFWKRLHLLYIQSLKVTDFAPFTCKKGRRREDEIASNVNVNRYVLCLCTHSNFQNCLKAWKETIFKADLLSFFQQIQFCMCLTFKM